MSESVGLSAFLVGVAVGIAIAVVLDALSAFGAHNACRDLTGSECELRWVPIAKAEGK